MDIVDSRENEDEFFGVFGVDDLLELLDGEFGPDCQPRDESSGSDVVENFVGDHDDSLLNCLAFVDLLDVEGQQNLLFGKLAKLGQKSKILLGPFEAVRGCSRVSREPSGPLSGQFAPFEGRF